MSHPEPRTSPGTIGLLAGTALFLLLLALPAPDGLAPAAWRAAAVALLMAVWWMTEALPIPVTAILPPLLFPLLGVADVRAASAPYANPLIFLFLGGFLLALGLERWQLHRRLALSLITALGTRPSRIVAGFLLASALLSMWISNTATAMLMLPIGLSVADLVEGDAVRWREGATVDAQQPTRSPNFTLCLLLGIAYACSIGGMGTLIGTPTNALLAAYMLQTYGIELGFLEWLLMGLPLVAVGLVVVWWVLVRWVYPLQVTELPGGAELVRRQLQDLGPMSTAEKRVAVIFGVTALLWITRPQLDAFLPGLSDPGIAVFSALLLFLVPSGMSVKTGGAGSEVGASKLLTWGATRRLPWGLLLLFGGGLSLASAIQSSPTPETSLAAWIGGGVESVGNWPPLLLTLLVVLLIIFLTELTSNTATAAAFLPILGSVAVGIGIAPLTLLVPATLAASCAFMLPVATPPNAIIYGSDRITIPQMARAGLVLNLIFWFLVTVAGMVLPGLLGGTS